MPGVPEMQTAPALALLEGLVEERFAYYTKCCETVLDSIGSADALWRVYTGTIRRSYLPIALMASRLPSVESFVARLHKWTREWLVKSQSRQKDIFDSFLAISGSSTAKAPLGSCLFVCHFCDMLSYCRPSGPLNGLSLEHYFAFLHEVSQAERIECLPLLTGLACKVHQLCPDLFYAAVTDVIRQPLLKCIKHELLIRSISELHFDIFPIDRLLINLRFWETLALAFATVHGSKVKEAYLCLFSALFSKLAGRLEAESNLAEWRAVVETVLYKKVLEFLGKPRYNALSTRLLAHLVLVSSDDFFRKHWTGAAELVLTRIREKYLEPEAFRLVIHLLHVYLRRYPEAWATMSNRVEGLNKSVNAVLHVLVPIKADRALLDTYIHYIIICGCKLTRLTFNEMVVPLLNVAGSPHPSESVLKRLHAGMAGYVEVVKRLQQRHNPCSCPDAPDYLSAGLKPITDDFMSEHIQIDFASMHIKYCSLIGQVLLYLDEHVLWDDSLYDGRAGPTVPCEDSLNALACIYDSVPEIVPTFADRRLFFMLVVKYLYFDVARVRDSAFCAIQKTIRTGLSVDSEETARRWEMLLWALVGTIDSSNERCHEGRQSCCRLLGELLAVEGGAWRYLPEDDRAAVLSEVATKAAILMMDTRMADCCSLVLRSCRPLLQSLPQSSPAVLNYADFVHNQSLDILCSPVLVEALKGHCSKKIADLSACITAQRHKAFIMSAECEPFLAVHSNYIRFLLTNGPSAASEDSGKRKGRRVSISSAFSSDSVVSTHPSSKHPIQSIAHLCQLSLPSLLHDSVFVRKSVVGALQACSASHLDKVLLGLVPYGKIISDDLRNIKYRFSRRNKKSDQLKLDLTAILAGLMNNALLRRPDLFTDGKAKMPAPTQFLLKVLLETFYFCSEIDVEASLASLRLNLCRMITGWSKAVLDSCREKAIRFQYLPFKLHSEMWMTLRRWLVAGLRERKDHGQEVHERKASGSTFNSSEGTVWLECSREAEIDAIIEAMGVLSWGLKSPPAGHRHEGVSLEHFFQWTDLLTDLGASEKAKEALQRLVQSNPCIMERVLDQAHWSKCPLYTHIASEAVPSRERLLVLQATKK